jgi:hypothetical protein
MPYDLSDEELRGVLAAPDEKQYAYFVNKVADFGEVWSLFADERWAALEDEGRTHFPVWPHPGFATGSCTGGWDRHVPRAIEVHRFLDVLQRLQDDGQEVAIMQRAAGDYLRVPPQAVAEDLRAALEEIE